MKVQSIAVVKEVPASYPKIVFLTPEPAVMESPALVPPNVFSSESELTPPPPAAASQPASPLASTVKT